MKLLTVLFFASSLFAASGDITIESFSVVRTGGGDFSTVVRLDTAGRPYAYTTSCNFQALPLSEQQKTSFYLSGTEATQALAILKNTAVLATEATVTNPYNAGGTWVNLEVAYSYQEWTGGIKKETSVIQKPLVLINNQLTNVLSSIEESARKAAPVCK